MTTIPQSFLDTPCYRCEGFDAVFDEARGIWLCPCFYAPVAQPEPQEPRIIRPDWDALRRQVQRRRKRA